MVYICMYLVLACDDWAMYVMLRAICSLWDDRVSVMAARFHSFGDDCTLELLIEIACRSSIS